VIAASCRLQLLKLEQLQLQYMQCRLEEKVEADQALEDDSLAKTATDFISYCLRCCCCCDVALLLCFLQLLKLAQLQLQYMQYRLEEKVEAVQALQDDLLAIAAVDFKSC
jgi:hypothetical protein